MDKKPNKNYDVFICYHSAGGQDYAVHLWEKLPHYGLTAFINIKDVDEIYERESDEYRNVIDKAIENCKYFIIIMTRGFKDREEIKREYKLARDIGKRIIHCKYINLDKKDCIMKIKEDEYNLYDIDYIEFSNNSNLYNGITDTIEGKIPPRISNVDPLKKELFEKFFDPIYSDIQIIIEQYDKYGYEHNHNTSEYDRVGRQLRFKLNKFKNKKLKEKIDKFYNISNERNKYLSLYSHRANLIINKIIDKFNDELEFNWKIDRKRELYMDVEVKVKYLNEKEEVSNTLLTYDLLYKKIGAHSLRLPKICSAEFVRGVINTYGGPAVIITGILFSDLWKEIILESEKDETFDYLRDGVETVKSLGAEILKEIDEEFSDLY